MYYKLLELKENKKWLYYLLIVPIGILFILELYNKYLSNSVKNIVKNAEKKDKKIQKKQLKLEQDAENELEKSKSIEKNIKNTKISKDWHLK